MTKKKNVKNTYDEKPEGQNQRPRMKKKNGSVVGSPESHVEASDSAPLPPSIQVQRKNGADILTAGKGGNMEKAKKDEKSKKEAKSNKNEAEENSINQEESATDEGFAARDTVNRDPDVWPYWVKIKIPDFNATGNEEHHGKEYIYRTPQEAAKVLPLFNGGSQAGTEGYKYDTEKGPVQIPVINAELDSVNAVVDYAYLASFYQKSGKGEQTAPHGQSQLPMWAHNLFLRYLKLRGQRKSSIAALSDATLAWGFNGSSKMENFNPHRDIGNFARWIAIDSDKGKVHEYYSSPMDAASNGLKDKPNFHLKSPEELNLDPEYVVI